MASSMTQWQSSSLMICVVTPVHIPAGLKAISLKAAMAIINAAIALFGTLANGLVIMAYYRNPRLRTIQNTIFLLLAVTDIAVSAFVEPMYVAAIFNTLLGKRNCLLWDVTSALAMLFWQLSLVASAILSLQSYITLAYPYHYQTIITKSRLIITIVFTSLFVLSLVLGYFWRRNISMYGSAGIAFLAITTIILTWCWTYKLVARHRRAIEMTQTPSTNENISRKKILRSTITAFVIVSSLMACYSVASFLFFSDKFLNFAKLTRETFAFLMPIAVTLLHLNSLLNPCLVFWRSSSFRETAQNNIIC